MGAVRGPNGKFLSKTVSIETAKVEPTKNVPTDTVEGVETRNNILKNTSVKNKQYSVALVFQGTTTGSTNISVHHEVVEANNIEEAFGKVYLAVFDMYPSKTLLKPSILEV